MRKTQTVIPNDVAETLRAGGFRDGASWVYVLPSELDRSHYTLCDEVLQRYGAKWSKKNQGHLFASDAQVAAFKLAIASGEMVERNALAYYPTPEHVARRLCNLVAQHDKNSALVRGGVILEPSCGDGALGKVIHEYWPLCDVIGVEIDPERAAAAFSSGVFQYVHIGDFMTRARPVPMYDAVIMNPPFDKNAWIEHASRAWAMTLEDGGIFAAILPASYGYLKSDDARSLRVMLETNSRSYVTEPVEHGEFRESGTNVGTVLVVSVKS